MTDEITKRLEELEKARKEMQAQLEATSEALDAITEKIDNLNERQQARMRSNDRIDNKVVDRVHGKTGNAGTGSPTKTDEEDK